MNIIIVLFSILFISCLGYSVIRGFNFLPKQNNLLALGMSYGLGIGLITMQLFLYSRLNILWQKELLISPWVIFIIFIIIKNRHPVKLKSIKIPNLFKIESLLVAAIIFTACYVLFEALIRPVSSWDAWSTWLVESKVFFLDGKINAEVFNYLQSDYPLVVKLLGTFIFLMLGKVDDTAVLLTSFAFYIFSGLLLFAVVKNKYGVRYALLFTFLFVTTQNFIRHGGRMEAGLADLPLGYYSFICTILLLNYLKKSISKNFLLLNIFLGIAILTKFEGVILVFFVEICALYHIYRQKLYNHLYFIIFLPIPYIDWQIYRKIHNIESYYVSGHNLSISFQKTFNAFEGMIKEFVRIKSWNVLWIIYFYSLFSFGVKKSYELFVLNFLILSQLLCYLFIYIFTAGNNPESSIERLLIHVAPLVFFYLAILIQELRIKFHT